MLCIIIFYFYPTLFPLVILSCCAYKVPVSTCRFYFLRFFNIRFSCLTFWTQPIDFILNGSSSRQNVTATVLPDKKYLNPCVDSWINLWNLLWDEIPKDVIFFTPEPFFFFWLVNYSEYISLQVNWLECFQIKELCVVGKLLQLRIKITKKSLNMHNLEVFFI